MRSFPRIARRAVLVMLFAAAPGCALLPFAAAAGAGAAGAVALTDHGAQSLIEAPIGTVRERTRAVFEEFRIEGMQEEEGGGGSRMELKGTNGPLDVAVELERREPNLTLVIVSASQGEAVWKREYASMVLEAIVKER